MDIKSIIDSEDALPSRKPSVPIPARQDHLPSSAGYSNFYNPQTPVPEDRRDGRPPQPSPLQTPAYGDSKYSNVTPLNISTSPYQHAPPSSLSSTQYPLPQLSGQSPAHGHQTTQYLQREGHTAPAPSNSSFGCSTPSSQTPSASTPGSAHGHSGYPRPTSSHSIPTPNPAQQPLGYSKESPQQSYGQIRSLSQPQTGQQHMSQPGVPLGPPSTYARSSLNIRRGSPGIYEREQSLTRGSHGQLQNSTPLPTLAGSPPSYGARQSRSMSHDYPIKLEREQSLSVSPKTRLPSLPRIDSFGQPQYQPGSWSGQVTPSKRQAEADMPDGTREPSMNQTLSRAASTSVNGLLNATISSEVMKGVNRLSQPSDGSPERKTTPFDYIPRRQTPPTDNHINSPSVSSVPRSTMSPSAKADDLAATGDSPSLRTKKRTHKVISGDVEVKQSIDLENNRSFREDVITVAQPVKKKPRLGEPMGDSMPPSLSKPNAEKSQNATDLPSVTSKAKPRRWKEIPIWAQSIPGFPRQGRPANGNPRRQATGHSSNGIISTQSSGQVNAMQKINGHSHQINDVHVPVAQPDLANMGPLGPWEPSIANYIPSEELTKIISDWLFQHVVLREDVGVATAGGVAGQGAVLEIEAKIGQLIDKNTNDRLHLPVLNECVVSHSDPNLRIAFKSSMTEVSRHFNAP